MVFGFMDHVNYGDVSSENTLVVDKEHFFSYYHDNIMNEEVFISYLASGEGSRVGKIRDSSSECYFETRKHFADEDQLVKELNVIYANQNVRTVKTNQFATKKYNAFFGMEYNRMIVNGVGLYVKNSKALNFPETAMVCRTNYATNEIDPESVKMVDDFFRNLDNAYGGLTAIKRNAGYYVDMIKGKNAKADTNVLTVDDINAFTKKVSGYSKSNNVKEQIKIEEIRTLDGPRDIRSTVTEDTYYNTIVAGEEIVPYTTFWYIVLAPMILFFRGKVASDCSEMQLVYRTSASISIYFVIYLISGMFLLGYAKKYTGNIKSVFGEKFQKLVVHTVPIFVTNLFVYSMWQWLMIYLFTPLLFSAAGLIVMNAAGIITISVENDNLSDIFYVLNPSDEEIWTKIKLAWYFSCYKDKGVRFRFSPRDEDEQGEKCYTEIINAEEREGTETASTMKLDDIIKVLGEANVESKLADKFKSQNYCFTYTGIVESIHTLHVTGEESKIAVLDAGKIKARAKSFKVMFDKIRKMSEFKVKEGKTIKYNCQLGCDVGSAFVIAYPDYERMSSYSESSEEEEEEEDSFELEEEITELQRENIRKFIEYIPEPVKTVFEVNFDVIAKVYGFNIRNVANKKIVLRPNEDPVRVEVVRKAIVINKNKYPTAGTTYILLFQERYHQTVKASLGKFPSLKDVNDYLKYKTNAAYLITPIEEGVNVRFISIGNFIYLMAKRPGNYGKLALYKGKDIFADASYNAYRYYL